MPQISASSPLTRQYLLPTRIVWHGDGAIDPPDMLRALERASGQVSVFGPKGSILRQTDAGGMLVDFGRELHGGIQLVVGQTPGQQPVRLRVRFGESVSEAMHSPVNDHGMHELTVETAWMSQSDCGSTGFRFARIDVVEAGNFVEIQGLRAILLARDLPAIGHFECSDPRLNDIWQTGAWTVQLNMQDYLWDGIKRDRLVWMGDLHPEMMVINAVFGHCDVVTASLDFAREETPLPGWMNTMSSYSLWWILAQHDWYLYQGDRDYLRRQREYLLGLLAQVEACVAGDGSMQLPATMLDHPMSRFPAAVLVGHQALVVLAYEAAGRLLRALDEPQTAGEWEARARRLRQRVPDPGASKQAAALLLLAGMRDQHDPAMQALFQPPDRHFSPFFGYYVLQARAKAGDYVGCLDLIRRYWGGMLDLGATTFWEHFDLDWLENAGRIDELPVAVRRDVHAECGEFCYTKFRHSLCHGWSAGPTAWLSRHVLGIHPGAPGFETVTIAPQLGDLRWASGAFPTPFGPIHVEHRQQDDGKVTTKLELPKGICLRDSDSTGDGWNGL